ncbi:MAG: methyltransferase domain-containing protein [Xanthomonadales bacterium]|nr:methyltransferase domain-containing protein [Xanthomonadales bacterium]NNL95316.1 methyltransferase domain-containing protein [Xanthomonadales bacterium]
MTRRNTEQPDASSLGHEPEDRWTFDESVTRVFSDMLQRSIPQYDEMRHLVFDLGRRFVQSGTDIVDLGCSRGDALAPFIGRFGDQCRYIGLEMSQPMLSAARSRFAGQIEQGIVSILEHDLRQSYPDVQASLTLCILTLQFTPPGERARILSDVRRSTFSNGALILVEKVLGESDGIDQVMVEIYHEMKTRHGYSKEEVDRKRLALEGVLVPQTAEHNRTLLKQAGFSQVDSFWRWMNFSAWIACP